MVLKSIYSKALSSLYKDKHSIINLKNKFSSVATFSEDSLNFYHPLELIDENKNINITKLKEEKSLYDQKWKKKLFSPVPRRVRRRLDRESKFTEEIRNLSKVGGQEKKKTKTSNKLVSNINLPWCDSTLWTLLSSSRTKTLPKRKPSITRREVCVKSVETCKKYLSHSCSISNSWFSCFCVAACHSAERIGLLSYNKRSKSNILTISQAVELTSKSTHSGTPLMLKKNDPENIRWMKRTLRDLFRNPSHGKMRNLFTDGLTFNEKGIQQAMFELPQMLFRRYQIDTTKFSHSDPNSEFVVKPRVVWCIPHIIVCLESIFVGDLVDRCKLLSQSDPRYTYSISQNNRRISNSLAFLRSDCRRMGRNNTLYSLDYSKFDQTVPLFFFDIFFAIIESNLDMTTHESMIFEDLRLYIKHTPMVFENKLVFKERGISSGLFITNLFDSLLNLTLLKVTELLSDDYPEYYEKILSNKGDYNFLYDKNKFKGIFSVLSLNRYNIRVLGDDGLVYWNPKNLIFLQKICFLLGMSVSIKGTVDNVEMENIFYLGRYWDKDNIPDQTYEYISGHIIFRSKFYSEDKIDFDIKDLDVMRILSICLPLKSGLKYLNELIIPEYAPMRQFLQSKKSFYLLKEWPNEGYDKFEVGLIPTDPLDY